MIIHKLLVKMNRNHLLNNILFVKLTKIVWNGKIGDLVSSMNVLLKCLESNVLLRKLRKKIILLVYLFENRNHVIRCYFHIQMVVIYPIIFLDYLICMMQQDQFLPIKYKIFKCSLTKD
ncbi:unnamed protein product [Onchocerca flexuosa]|uniref:Uncharacterized protein n=1 Tax=Onchocerca flexuosa TaxID=387005 RepID=A0A183HIZ5_9BILA|nr:unnamed protein product [Onchocerca flexuosa]